MRSESTSPSSTWPGDGGRVGRNGAAMTRKILAAAIGAGIWLASAVLAAAQAVPQPQTAEDRAEDRQLWLLSIPGERLRMHAYVFRPPGPGPFRLAVINHGSIQAGDVREKYR